MMSMSREESFRANPIDGVLLLVGCDKTTPASVMGACSVNLPTIAVSGGAMLTGKYRGKDIGTSDVWRCAAEVSAGRMEQDDCREMEGAMCRSRRWEERRVGIERRLGREAEH